MTVLKYQKDVVLRRDLLESSRDKSMRRIQVSWCYLTYHRKQEICFSYPFENLKEEVNRRLV